MSEKNLNISFSINPLDINLAKMQFNILKKYEENIPSIGDFAPIIEEYSSKDSTLDISLIHVIFKNTLEDSKVLELVVYNKSQENKSCIVLCEGTNDDIWAYLKKSDFVIDAKKFIQNIKY